ncbi:MAG: endonuclease NucS [Gemmatimonadaceae bacterium]|nr:endonuclease NucS [Gemmatimonadaceae bacterium]
MSLFAIDVVGKDAKEVPPSSLTVLGLKERYDLQEWVLAKPALLGEELLVITSEYSGFDRTSERLDVLCLDKDGVLTVVELKRSATGSAAELQGLRYAAYCSTLSLRDVAELLAAFHQRRTQIPLTTEQALERIRTFVDDPGFSEISDRPRIILGAEDFPPEITSTVLWLRGFGVDVSCVRLRPYCTDAGLLLESSVLIPLPETRAYQIRRESKEAETPRARTREEITADEYLESIDSSPRQLLEPIRAWLLGRPDVQERAFRTLLSYRRVADREWVTWLQATRTEVRVAIRPEIEIDPDVFVRRSSGGWSLVRVKSNADVATIVGLLEQSASHDGPTPPKPGS